MKKYDPNKIEKKWQGFWESKKLYNAKDSVKGKENFMLLAEFPYTSGNLHMGHWFTYSIADILARYLRMRGQNVMYPIGFDAFGLPGENAAIKNNTTPGLWTKQNIKKMTSQIKSIGATFDWSRIADTSSPDYYKWTQWIFLVLYKNNLAYRAETKVNWCPKDKTVLANEQVVNGCCERCDTPVVQKDLTQWMFKITKFSDQLIDDIKDLDWPTDTKLAQQNWIGRSEGTKIKFYLTNITGQTDKKHFVEVFTTRADTLFGATFVVVSPELAQKWIDVGWQASDEVKNYINKSLAKRELERQEAKEKTGVDTGIFALNPINDEKIPVWVADYVLGHYGTGAVMSVPAHDQRDFEFANKFSLPIRHVIEPVYIQTTEPGKVKENLPFDQRDAIIAIVKHWSEDKYIGLKWKEVAWGTFITGGIEKGQTPEEAAKMEIKEETGYLNPKLIKDFGIVHGKFYHVPKKLNRFAHAHVLYFELQNDTKEDTSDAEKGIHEIMWLTKNELQKFLTSDTHQHGLRMLTGEQEAYEGEGMMTNSGEFNNITSEEGRKRITEALKKKETGDFMRTYRLHDWILSRQRYWGVPIPMINCPQCGYIPVEEKDLPIKLPPLKDFIPSDDGRSPLAKATKWLSFKCPKCGLPAERETDTMDTFVDSSWYFIRYTDPKNKKFFADRSKINSWLPVPVYIGGREHNTMHLLYSRFIIKALHSLGYLDFNETFTSRRNHGVIMGPDGKRMSKSRGNVVDPDAEVAKFGADTIRLNFAFLGPFEQDYAWNNSSINGVNRFLNRVWNFVGRYDKNVKPNIKAQTILNKAIKSIGDDIRNFSFNTGVSGLMKLLNDLESHELSKGEHETFLKLFAPFAPHIAEELWREVLKNKKSIHLESWPEYDKLALAEEKSKVAIQVNGKLRDVMEFDSGAKIIEIKEDILKNPKVEAYIKGKTVKNMIYVPGRVVNIVVE